SLDSSPLSSEATSMTSENKKRHDVDDAELQDHRSYSSDEGYINKYRYTHNHTWQNTGKPREHKITNFFKNDMMDVMQKSEGEEGEEKAYLSVWDFGGQKVFYDSHHIFLSKDAVYIVCFNVDDCLSDAAKKNAEFERARFWLHSIGSLSSKQNSSSEQVELPPIILVGTHMDKVEGMDADTKKSKFIEMCTWLLKPPELQKIKNHIQGYCAVDNSNRDLPWLDNLWEDIIKAAPFQSQWKRALPAKWLSLERELMKLKGQGQKIMSFKEVTELDMKLESPIENVREIEVFL
ncbi:probable inactive serine/threonine-protein kinase roco10, partial [Mizuhopecten yessoensis]|uniref:probable inactive serine/threonine-protein kinase roco10 n=1 Tax=Mizuhopecten yessoensis TaxID=6573 RepID=UPI000B45896A